jgi:iron-sulfur cluster repair protein YtfE (RIC family)
MDAIQMLKQDHDKVKQMFQQYRQGSTSGGGQRQTIVQQCCQELFVHSELEKQIFYPACERAGDNQIQAMITEGRQEHQKVDRLVQQLMQMGGGSQQADSMFQELMQNVDHHVQEEETELFPLVQQRMGQELSTLGQQMQQQKQQLMTAAPR